MSYASEKNTPTTDAFERSPISENATRSLISAFARNPSEYLRSAVPETEEKTTRGKEKKKKGGVRKTSERPADSSPAFGPYWNDDCSKASSRLWLPTLCDERDAEMQARDSSLMSMLGRSWFSVEAWTPGRRIEPPAFRASSRASFPSGSKDGAETPTIIRVKRVRIYPDAIQRNLFRQWFGTSRLVYNETVKHLNLPAGQREKTWISAAKKIMAGLPDWASPVPYETKREAVHDAYKAFSNECKKAKKSGKPFKLSFRSRKDPKQSCFIPATALRDDGVFPTLAGKLRRAEPWPEGPRDSRLVLEHGRWFLMVPYRVVVAKAESQGRAVAIDPGVRTFATCFAEDMAVKIGAGDFARIARLGRSMDDLISRMSGVGCRKRRRMKKALARMKWKMWDLIDEIHFKTINLLLSAYDVVIFPESGTSEMVAKSTRKIRSKTVRAMLTYAFHRFSQRLESKAKSLGKSVARCSEAWTSKTASWTGEIKNIGSAKSIKSGGVRVDRDINGARGIFLRALGDTPSLKASSVHSLANAA